MSKGLRIESPVANASYLGFTEWDDPANAWDGNSSTAMSGMTSGGAIANLFTGPDHSALGGSIIWSGVDIDWEGTATEVDGFLKLSVNGRDDVIYSAKTYSIPTGGQARGISVFPFPNPLFWTDYQNPPQVVVTLQRGVGVDPSATASVYEVRFYARDRVSGSIIEG
jgi:hypothetical protein